MVKQGYVPDRGDVIWIDLEPAKGREQKGSRPALVISPKSYNSKVRLLLACPITSHTKGYPFEVTCKFSGIEGVILADQVRSMDWDVRRVKRIATAPASVTNEVEQRLLALIKS